MSDCNHVLVKWERLGLGPEWNITYHPRYVRCRGPLGHEMKIHLNGKDTWQ